MSSTTSPTVPEAVVRYIGQPDTGYTYTASVADVENTIRLHAADGLPIREWNLFDRDGAPLRIVDVNGKVAEIQAWYRVEGLLSTTPAVDAIGHDRNAFPALPVAAREFEGMAKNYGWMTAVTLTEDVAVVTAARDLRYGGGYNPQNSDTCFTITWKRNSRHFWSVRSQESVIEGTRRWSRQELARDYIATHPVEKIGGRPVEVRELPAEVNA